jgi:predicted Zn finger-like uncharacterized protein
MIIQCAACQHRFKVADEKVSERGVRVRCTRCKSVFVVRREAKGADATPAQGGPPPLGAALSAAQGAPARVARAGPSPGPQTSPTDLISAGPSAYRPPSAPSPRPQVGAPQPDLFGLVPAARSALSSPEPLGAPSDPLVNVALARPPLGLKPNPLPLPPSPYGGLAPAARPPSGSGGGPLSMTAADPFAVLAPSVHPPAKTGALAPSPHPFDLALAARPESSALAATPDPGLDLALPALPDEGAGSLAAGGASAAPAPDPFALGFAGPKSSPNPASPLDQGPDPFGLPASPPAPRAGPLTLAPQPDPFAVLETRFAPNSAIPAPAQSLLPDLNSFDLSLPEESGSEPGPSGELRLDGPMPEFAPPPRSNRGAPELAPTSGLELDVDPERLGAVGPGERPKVPPKSGALPARWPAGRSPEPMSGGGARRRRSVAAALVNALGVFAVAAAVLVVALRYPPPGRLPVSRPADLVHLLSSRPEGDLLAADVTRGLYETQCGRALFVVRGEVVNRAAQPRGPVEVVAELQKGSDPARREVAFAGEIPTPEDLWRIDGKDALAALKARLNAGALRLEPHARAPFAAVFLDWPEDSAHCKLRLALREASAVAPPGVGSSSEQPAPRRGPDVQGAVQGSEAKRASPPPRAPDPGVRGGVVPSSRPEVP